MKNNEIPITSYVVKLTAICNLNCTYCYEYNMGDNSWQSMPKYMPLHTVDLLALKINEHCKEHCLTEVYINLHGGEPLLYGYEKTEYFVQKFTNELEGIKIHWGVQTNGLLINHQFVELFAKYNFNLGLSIDGYKETNDLFRVDFSGKGSYDRIIRATEILKTANGQKIFSGILSVVNVYADPVKCFYELIELKPKAIDFLLPHHNWDNLPPTKNENIEDTSFADWYIKIFDIWFEKYAGQIQIRTFEEIIQHLIGGNGKLETMGLEPVSLLVIAPNGDMEGVDTLKSIPGQQVLNLSIHRNSFNDAIKHNAYKFRNLGLEVLHEKCKKCNLVNICGAGYIPHRWSSKNKYENPSVYCSDLIKLILHINESVYQYLKREKAND